MRSLFDQNWSQAEQIDNMMKQSVSLCLQALNEKDEGQGYNLLTKALSLGEDCFRKWRLISYDLERHIEHLKTNGALAVKPTGSGLGGHVISLWDTLPPSPVKKQLLALKV